VNIENLNQAERILAGYIPLVKKITGKDITLERMKPLMQALGNPQNNLKIIHIAGTSGKTSTAYYLANLLKIAGKKVGLTVSPHLDSITERVQIDLEPLGETEFCQAFGEFIDIIKPVEPEPTYFELLMAFAYWYFAKTGVDYVLQK
jgi:dihydrofolate synthase / folylpolyglutamate synthase